MKLRLSSFIVLALWIIAVDAAWAQRATDIAQRYVVVTHADCVEPLQPLLQWKRQCGYEVLTMVTNTADKDTIRQQLKSLYLNATPLVPAPTYVLLVGDVDRIEAFDGRYRPSSQFDNHPTDLYYGEYTGDYVPEAYVGRLSIATVDELRQVIDKTLRYEQCAMPETDYLERLLLVAGREAGTPAPTTTNGQVNYLKELFTTYNPALDTACFYNPHSYNLRDSILQHLQQGATIVNYTAHCLEDGWLNPTITAADMDSNITQRYRLYVNNCCLSNRYNGNCFGEQLLCHGDAIGVIGASNETLWEEDYFWSVGAKLPLSLHPAFGTPWHGAFDRLLADNECATQGALMQAGNRAVMQAGSPNAAYYWEIYNLLGDPSLMPYVGMPQTADLATNSVPAVGDGMVEVSGSPHLRVAATVGDRLMGVTTTDSLGHGTIWLQQPLTTDSLGLTATAQGYRPKWLRIAPATPASPRLALLHYTIAADSMLTLTLQMKNPNAVALQEHTVELEGQTLTVESLAPYDSTTIVYRRGLPIGEEPYYTAVCHLADANGIYSHHLLRHDCQALHPSIRVQTLTDLYGNPVDTLATGHHYHLAMAIDNPTDSLCHMEIGNSHHTIAPHSTLTVEHLFGVGDSSTHIGMAWHARCATWSKSDSLWMAVGSSTEEFESGTLTNYPWHNSSPLPWSIDSSTTHSGHYSLRSGAIGKLQTTTLSIEIETLKDDSISFWRKTSSESGADKLTFSIDGHVVGTWSGQKEWYQNRYALSGGRHTLKWSYSKDGSGSHYQDCAWIDDVRFPLALWDAPYGTHLGHDSNAVPTPPKAELQFAIYPNPAHHTITLRNDSQEPCQITLFDGMGRHLDHLTVKPMSETQYSVAHLRFGIYTFLIKTPHQQTVNKVLIAH